MLRQLLPESQMSTGLFGEIPAPTGGWNARDPISAMKPNDAIYLDNIFPRTTDVVNREGWDDYAEVTAVTLKSLLSFSAQNGTQKLFAANGTGIYDVTAGGVVSAAASNCTDGDWQGTMISTAGGNFLWMCNGVDDSRYFDGTSFTNLNSGSTPSLTGITSANIVHVNHMKERLFFCEKDSLSFWYLPVNSVAGLAVEFPLGALFKRGGYLVATANWTIDAGEGMDDHFVAITSEGELAVYKGTNPADAASWVLVGTFMIGAPLGKNCFTKIDGDLAILTVRGIWPLSKALLTSGTSQQKAITDKIDQAFASYAEEGKDFHGWGATLFPKKNMLIVNMPKAGLNSSGEPSSDQAVMNTITGAWCRFTEQNANAFTLHDGGLYFVAGKFVRKACSAESDAGDPITVKCKMAFQRWGKRAGRKKTSLIKPIILVNDRIPVQLGIDVDYEDNPLELSDISYKGNLSRWDEALWDEGIWETNFTSQEWRTVNHKMGSTLSLRLRFDASGVTMVWSATEYIVEPGTNLL